MKSALCYIACLNHVSLCLPCCRWQCDAPRAMGSTERPYMQALHFSFGLGAFIAPLIASPFLSPLPVVMDTKTMPLVNYTTTATPLVDSAQRNVRSVLGTDTEYHHETSTKTTYVTLSAVQTGNITHLSKGSSTEDVATTVASLAKVMMNTLKKHLGNITKIHFAYLLIAVFLSIVAFVFIATLCHECVTRSKLASENVDDDTVTRDDSPCFHTQLLALMFVFYYALLTSVFWRAFAFGRRIAIFLSRYLSPTVMLVADLALSVASIGTLALAPHANP